MSPQRRREQLVAAALELYGRLPPEEVAVSDVTRTADCSRALFYRYFPNVESLHVAALGTVVAELIERVAMPAGGDPGTQPALEEQLGGAVDAFLDVAQRHARAYVALLRSGSVISTGETDALVDGVRDHFVDLLVLRGGLADPSPLQLMTLRGWVALVEGATLTWLEQGEVGRETMRDWLVAQLFALLGVTARHEPR
ncbi:TetR/AcrR family transcriptional regulator [Pseudonocardia sp. KRD-291]|nr:TetR/AcrR family transcriptional regulator [Pseudonocardia sp. KRD291]